MRVGQKVWQILTFLRWVPVIFGGMLAVMFCKHWFQSDIGVDIPGYERLNIDAYPDLGINEAESFPADGPNRIQKIIHQTWKGTDIPDHYVEWMKSWIKNHPDWTYMFWTDATARGLISDKYPELLPTYDGYLENIRRADALRYVILYEYGGIYVDLDMENLLPLDPIIRKYSCVLPQEPYEHPMIDSNFEHLVINALMACRKGHPLMKQLMDNLSKYFHMWNVLDSTGPHFMTLQYKNYIENGHKDQAAEDGVYIAPAEYFFPTIDPVKFSYMKDRCSNFDQISNIQKRACISLKKHGLKRRPYPFSFTDHHWVHTYLTQPSFFKQSVSINVIVPTVVTYKREMSNVF